MLRSYPLGSRRPAKPDASSERLCFSLYIYNLTYRRVVLNFSWESWEKVLLIYFPEKLKKREKKNYIINVRTTQERKA